MLFVAFHTFFLVFSFTSADHVTVNPGEDVVLQCQTPREAAIRLLEWIRPDLKEDGEVFFYRNDRSYEKYQHPSFHGRVELRDPEMKDGDVSVILKKVTTSDTGTYECRIINNITTISGSELRNTVNLKVSHSGHTAENKGEVETDEIIVDTENIRIIKLGFGLFFAVLLVVVGSVLCFVKCRKHRKRFK